MTIVDYIVVRLSVIFFLWYDKAWLWVFLISDCYSFFM